MNDDYECAKCHRMVMLRDGCEPTKYCDGCAHIVEALDQKTRPAKNGTREPGYYRAFLLGLKAGEVVDIEPAEQRQFLRVAKRMGLQIATAKTATGGMLLVRLKIARRYRKCPHCHKEIV